MSYRALIKVASHKEDDGYHFDPPTTLGIIFESHLHRLTVSV
ncbi:MAG: hypothetical protein ACLTS1_13155 [Coprococcus sp.]